MCCAITPVLRCFRRSSAPGNDKVILQASFKKKILKKAQAIISSQNSFWPSDLKGYYIAKHNLEPTKYEKFINKLSKPTSKVIASFTVEWTISPAISALFLTKVIAVAPWLSILGTTYWLTITVSLLAIAVHPILMFGFGTILRATIATYHLVVANVHYFVISQLCPEREVKPANMDLTFANLTREINYDKERNEFYAMQGTKRTEIPTDLVTTFFAEALQLEKYNLLLEGDKSRIEKTFAEVQLSVDASASFSDVARPIKFSKLSKQYHARLALDQVCSNQEKQFYHDDLIIQLIEKPSWTAAKTHQLVMGGDSSQRDLISSQTSIPFASSSEHTV